MDPIVMSKLGRRDRVARTPVERVQLAYEGYKPATPSFELAPEPEAPEQAPEAPQTAPEPALEEQHDVLSDLLEDED